MKIKDIYQLEVSLSELLVLESALDLASGKINPLLNVIRSVTNAPVAQKHIQCDSFKDNYRCTYDKGHDGLHYSNTSSYPGFAWE